MFLAVISILTLKLSTNRNSHQLEHLQKTANFLRLLKILKMGQQELSWLEYTRKYEMGFGHITGYLSL